jgi:hypothetical protein
LFPFVILALCLSDLVGWYILSSPAQTACLLAKSAAEVVAWLQMTVLLAYCSRRAVNLPFCVRCWLVLAGACMLTEGQSAARGQSAATWCNRDSSGGSSGNVVQPWVILLKLLKIPFVLFLSYLGLRRVPGGASAWQQHSTERWAAPPSSSSSSFPQSLTMGSSGSDSNRVALLPPPESGTEGADDVESEGGSVIKRGHLFLKGAKLEARLTLTHLCVAVLDQVCLFPLAQPSASD